LVKIIPTRSSQALCRVDLFLGDGNKFYQRGHI
jgi:hypothetical protein